MAKPLIVSISGPTNAGKTTVSGLLAKEMQAACIDGDAIRWFMPQLANEAAWPITQEAIVELIKLFLRHKVPAIVVDYIASDEDRENLRNRLPEADVACITLAPERAKLIADTADRTLLPHWRDRIDGQLAEGLHKSKLGLTIDSTNQTPEQTTDTVVQYLRGSYGRV